ncbi:hypothetical protein [Trichothermofontia sp.]
MIQDLARRLLVGITTLTTLTWPIAAIAASLGTLPVINGIRPGRVNYLPSETQPRPKVERAILEALAEPYTPDQSPHDRLRYYYNRIDLNGDRRLETIAYVVGRETCGRNGCLALIFTQSPQGLQQVGQFIAVHVPILVLDRKTRGWNDLVFFISEGDSPPRYKRVQFDGQTYANQPATESDIPPHTSLRGTAILANPIRLTNGLPLRTLAELPTAAPRPDSPDLDPDLERHGEAPPRVGQPLPTTQSSR